MSVVNSLEKNNYMKNVQNVKKLKEMEEEEEEEEIFHDAHSNHSPESSSLDISIENFFGFPCFIIGNLGMLFVAIVLFGKMSDATTSLTTFNSIEEDLTHPLQIIKPPYFVKSSENTITLEWHPPFTTKGAAVHEVHEGNEEKTEVGKEGEGWYEVQHRLYDPQSAPDTPWMPSCIKHQRFHCTVQYLQPSTQYVFRIRSASSLSMNDEDAGSKRRWSTWSTWSKWSPESSSMLTKAGIPSDPFEVLESPWKKQATSTSITIEWKGDNRSTYHIQISKHGLLSRYWETLSYQHTESTTFLATELQPRTAYRFRYRKLDQEIQRWSAWSKSSGNIITKSSSSTNTKKLSITRQKKLSTYHDHDADIESGLQPIWNPIFHHRQGNETSSIGMTRMLVLMSIWVFEYVALFSCLLILVLITTIFTQILKCLVETTFHWTTNSVYFYPIYIGLLGVYLLTYLGEIYNKQIQNKTLVLVFAYLFWNLILVFLIYLLKKMQTP